MGGALAVILSARVAQPDALVLVAPYLSMRARARRVAGYDWLLGPIIPYIATREEASIRDAAERASNRGFGTTTPRLLRELRSVVDRATSLLGDVRAPTLVIQSRADNRIDASAAEASFAALGTSDKKLVWIDEGGHVITVDTGRGRVLAIGGEWLVDRMIQGLGARDDRP
jgi:carboxylesterase